MERNKVEAEENSKELEFSVPEPLSEHEKKLLSLIVKFITKRQYKRVHSLFDNAKDAAANLACLPRISMDLYHEVCKNNLTEDTFDINQPLYKCVEQLLKLIAAHAPIRDFAFEVVLLIGGPDSPDCVFDSVLTFLGSLLLRMPDEYQDITFSPFNDCLDEIIMRRDIFCNGPDFLLLGTCKGNEDYMEDDEILDIFRFYIKIRDLYTMLLNEVLAKPRPKAEVFRSCLVSKRNMLCCFLIKLLDKPFAFFNLKFDFEVYTESPFTTLIATSITESITKCIGDPLFLLSFVEEQFKWESRFDTDKKDSSENFNIFLTEFSLPLDALAIYYYLVIVEDIDASKIPRIYNPLYVCEKGLYLVHILLTEVPVPALQEKALALAEKLLKKLGHIKIPSLDLDLDIHKRFLNDLCNLAINPKFTTILLLAVNVLKQYIFRLGDEDRYLILKQLMDTVKQPSFYGFLISVYKDIVEESLKETTKSLPAVLSGQHFQSVILEYICKLPAGVKTDPAENNDQIKLALHALRFFATNDKDNRTGFWNLTNDIHSKFLSPLRKALQFYEARYKAEFLNAKHGRCLSGRRGKNVVATQRNNIKKSGTLKDNLSDIAESQKLLDVVCELLADSPKYDQSSYSKTVK